MDEIDDSPLMIKGDVEAEIKEMLGLFDTPAFARRGLEVDETLRRMHDRCRRARADRLDMVRLRLRQWAGAVTGSEAWSGVFVAPITLLWPLSEAEPPRWSSSPGSIPRRLGIARDLVAAVIRFNRRWSQFLDRLNLDPVNHVIDQYNRYYVLEKECVMGSSRLAARFFVPVPMLTREDLLRHHPLLPVPELLEGRSLIA
jgi:hypothetical protein